MKEGRGDTQPSKTKLGQEIQKTKGDHFLRFLFLKKPALNYRSDMRGSQGKESLLPAQYHQTVPG